VSRAWPVPGIDPHGSVLENARRVLAIRIAELYSYEPIVSHPEMAEALHDLRIAAKRLRYTLELFKPQFGEIGARQIGRVKSVQESLGDLHDHDVRIDMIGAELSTLMLEQSRQMRAAIAAASPDDVASIASAALRPPPDDPRRGLIALLGREHAARRAAYARFREIWEQHASDGMRAELVGLSTFEPQDVQMLIGAP
jgi:hypothetical protein